MDEEYDPYIPNDFKTYKQEENIQHIEEEISTIVVVLNMIEEYNEEYQEECEIDLKDEAKRFGKLIDFSFRYDENNIHKFQFFLKFQTSAIAEMFKNSVNGRLYDKKILIAKYYPEHLYNNH